MREKIEVQRKQKIAYFKNQSVNEVLNTKEEYTIFKVYENDMLGISCIKNSEDNDYGYYMAEKNMKNAYTHSTTLNIQKNVIFEYDKITDKKLVDLLENIGNKLSKISKNITVKYIGTDIRYTLTNISKLHMNCQNGINTFELAHNNDKLIFEYKKLDEEKIISDMSQVLSADIKNAVKEDFDTIIIPTNMNGIYDFFENILSCKSVVKKNLSDKKLFSENFSLYTSLDEDDAKSTKYGIMPFFDAEGNHSPYYKSILIENGVIVKPYADRDETEKYDVENTACAYARYDEYPACKLLGACISPSDKKLYELASKAIYISDAEIITKDEEITISTKKAYLYENGKIAEKIENFDLKINTFRLFGEKFAGVSKDTTIGGDHVKGIVFTNINM